VRHNVEANSLGKRTALPNGNNIPILNRESGRAMHSNVLMPLLKTTVLGNVVKVIPPHNNGVLHLGADHQALEDAPADGHVAGEGALLVHVVALDGGGGGADSEADVSGEAHGFLAAVAYCAFACDEDGVLGLVGLFVLVALDVFLRYSWDPWHLFLIFIQTLGDGEDRGITTVVEQ